MDNRSSTTKLSVPSTRWIVAAFTAAWLASLALNGVVGAILGV